MRTQQDLGHKALNDESGPLRPVPSDYGLPPSITIDELNEQLENIKRRAFGRSFFYVTLFILLISALSYFWFGNDIASTSFMAYFLSIIGFSYHAGSLRYRVAEHFLNRQGKHLLAFKGAAEQWDYMEREKGIGFWLAQKGRDFEQSVALLFQRRGWLVELTAATGDRGVDVILKSGSAVYWCQCKGHSKPVSGAEVRRIAGATLKSRGKALPVLLSTNGFTAPALDEAKDLNVICIDGVGLSQLARLDVIPHL